MLQAGGDMLDIGHVQVFLFGTVALGGTGAWFIGRAIASIWRPWWQVVLAMLALAAVVRFFHFALFDGALLSPLHYLADAAVCLALGLLGYRATRAGQMARQYRWLYRRAGPLRWQSQASAPNAARPESG
jgi:hypothetical protein